MERREILDRVRGVIREIMDAEGMLIAEDLALSDMAEWDSLKTIQLVAALEEHFRVRLTVKEIVGMRAISDVISLIEAKRR